MTDFHSTVSAEIADKAPAGTPQSLLTQINTFLAPLLNELGSHVNVSALVTTVVMALATGGGFPAVLKAILSALPSIVSTDKIAAVATYGQGRLALHEAATGSSVA